VTVPCPAVVVIDGWRRIDTPDVVVETTEF
jgi:hypothetical protein